MYARREVTALPDQHEERGKKQKKAEYREAQMNRHHFLFPRRGWTLSEPKRLRLFWYCVIYLSRDTTHRAIHEQISYIPQPKESSAKEVLCNLEALQQHGVISDKDPAEKRLKLLAEFFEDLGEHPTAGALREQANIIHEFGTKPP